MTLKEKLHQFLKENPLARERRYRDKCLVKFMLKERKHGNYFTDAEILELAKSFETFSRLHRLILAENLEMQGNDYTHKEQLSQKKQLELGYEPHYIQNIKILKSLQ